jgi:hypothetical protein
VSAPWTVPSRAALAALPAILALLAGEGTARAAASARLFYGRAPAIEGCPDESELRRAIAQRVGYDPIFLMAPSNGLKRIVVADTAHPDVEPVEILQDMGNQQNPVWAPSTFKL